MRLLVCGGRDYRDVEAVWHVLDYFHARRPVTDLVHGACPVAGGADWIAEDWATNHGVAVYRCAVDSSLDGSWPGAGPRRNRRMLDTFRPDFVIAFPGGRGTRGMCRLAQEAGIRVWRPYDSQAPQSQWGIGAPEEA